MTEWLIQRFVSHPEDTSSSTARRRYGLLAGIVGIACNLILAIAKGISGALIGSVSFIADAANNLSDAASAIVSLLGFTFAARPADEQHPFGHGRFEYLSDLTVATLVVGVGMSLIWTSADRIANPSEIRYPLAVIVVLICSVGVKLWLSLFADTIGRRISSIALEATAIDARADAIATAVVLVSAVISRLTGVSLDGWAGLAVGAFVCWSGFNLVQEAVSPLLGSTPDPELVERIREKILSYPGILGTHDLMVHDYGHDSTYASAHVEIAAEADVLKSHDLIDTIEQDFKNDEGIIMTLHYDPIVTSDPNVQILRNWVDARVKDIDPRLSVHDLRCVPGYTHTNVIFDLVRPRLFAMSDEELIERVSAYVRERQPDAVCKVIIDTSYVSTEQ